MSSIVDTRAKGKNLTKVGELWGVKRKFFGLEPDYFFRKRILEIVKCWREQ
jgi:hypothetical protein